jgi:outer membrane protein assembly factor BamD
MKSLLLITIFLSVLSCATETPKGKTEAEILFKEAKSLIKDERYILATEKLNQLKNRYPYSFYATPAELLQADILFEQENFIEAAAAYLLFRDFHPKHEEIPFVIYRIAESYYAQVPDTEDRDLQSAVEAIKYYREILTSYSSSSYTKDAKKRIEKCQNMLIGKEKYVADFYFKTDQFKAARWRYLDILENIEQKKIRSHAMIRVVESSKRLRDYEKCMAYSDRYFQSLEKEDKLRLESLKTDCKKELK